jgi:uncharacterized protein YdeI (YjbR/CyaY-like superfamily)
MHFMGKKNPRIDEYIAKAADFAKPVLIHLRELVHKACPEVEENIKWSMPSFEYKGLLCGFASFKQHCTFGFWKAALMNDSNMLLGKESKTAMGNLGRITSMKDLPSDKIITGWIKEAMKLNEAGVIIPKDKTKHEKKPLQVPNYFSDAVKKNKKAWAVFEKFSTSHKRDYVEWITDAKTDETRKNRLKQAVEWMAEGKPRNWKYMKEYR